MNLLTALELLDLHINALFTHDSGGRICRINEPRGDVAPRFYLGRSRDGNRWRLRVDLHEELAHEIELIAQAIPISSDWEMIPPEVDAIARLLRAGAAVTSAGPAFQFPECLPEYEKVSRVTRESFPVLKAMGWEAPWLLDAFDQWGPILAVVEDGVAVSVCFCSRLTSRAAEAGLETDVFRRRQGYGAAVTAEWARAVRESGRIPLYSSSWENTASRTVASKLGLIPYAADLSIP